MKQLASFSLIIAILAVIFLLAPGAQAALDNPLGYDDFKSLIMAIANFLFNIALALAPIMIVIAAFYFLTSGGSPDKVNTAKRIIVYTLVGFAIILFSRSLVAILQKLLENS